MSWWKTAKCTFLFPFCWSWPLFVTLVSLVTRFVLLPPPSSRLSFDEGQRWDQYSFTSSPLYVDGVLGEPGEDTLIMTYVDLQQKPQYFPCVQPIDVVTTDRQTDRQNWTERDPDRCPVLPAQRKFIKKSKRKRKETAVTIDWTKVRTNWIGIETDAHVLALKNSIILTII